jgi:hypothetical protein
MHTMPVRSRRAAIAAPHGQKMRPRPAPFLEILAMVQRLQVRYFKRRSRAPSLSTPTTGKQLDLCSLPLRRAGLAAVQSDG